MFEIIGGGLVLKKYIPEPNESHVMIPNGICDIVKGAFSNCPDLVSVTLSEQVHSISPGAFQNCPKLSCINFNNGFASLRTSAEEAPFMNCPHLTSLELPATIDCCDLGESNVREVRISNGLQKLPDHIFAGSRNITTVCLPDSIKVIGICAFRGCSNLQDVKLPCGLQEIEYMAFWECRMLRDIDIPDSVRKIGNDCFSGSGITNVRIPSGITKIEECTFENCLNLHSIVIPETVQEIHKRAFNGSGLRSIRIPARVQVVGEGAFGGCNFLTDVTIYSRDTKFVKHIVPMFPENARLHGDGYRIPGPWKYEKITALFLALLIINSINTFLLIAALVGLYFYIKRKHQFLSLKKEDERKAIIDIEFARPWYKRVPIIEDNLPDYLRWGND